MLRALIHQLGYCSWHLRGGAVTNYLPLHQVRSSCLEYNDNNPIKLEVSCFPPSFFFFFGLAMISLTNRGPHCRTYTAGNRVGLCEMCRCKQACMWISKSGTSWWAIQTHRCICFLLACAIHVHALLLSVSSWRGTCVVVGGHLGCSQSFALPILVLGTPLLYPLTHLPVPDDQF